MRTPEEKQQDAAASKKERKKVDKSQAEKTEKTPPR
jgi:hypothetical protein